ncbi:uncharacterized protein VTP21DRAFT_8549 [Calcarisporiella thermophila]|uniref:uncharacterized protein n=1 Tax=Calcarisporiella thermophila TaxID=911321 RepID=UPI003744316A
MEQEEEEIEYSVLSSLQPILKDFREIGSLAIWSLSSCKAGFGVDQLRDDDLETYWQSDGTQPHLVNIQFPKRTGITHLCIFLDAKQDESYTPNKLSVRVGNSFYDLMDLHILDLEEPSGWVVIPLSSSSTGRTKLPLVTRLLQLAILSNHQNGKDTHVRQIKVFAPRQMPLEDDDILPFTSTTLAMHSTVR